MNKVSVTLIPITIETKIDDLFTNAQFTVDGFHCWRKDRTAHGGGLAVYVRADLPCDRKTNLDFKIIESLAIKICIGNHKWLRVLNKACTCVLDTWKS